MGAYFLDSSSLVKRFALEIGTRWMMNLFKTKPYHSIYAAHLTFVEVSSALARKAKSGSITIDAEIKASKRLDRAFIERVGPVETLEPVLLDAARLARKHLLRGYDAIQLASALRVASRRLSIGTSELVFVSADNDLNNAATVEGLRVENPNHHP